MPPLPTNTETIDFNFNTCGQPIHVQLTVPTGPARPRVILPLLQSLTNAVVDLAEKKEIAAGKTISCTKGCGACCRQLVPISRLETHHLAELIEKLPPDRRQEIKNRFAAATEKIKTAGMFEQLQKTEAIPDENVEEVALQYFSLGIPCPFLEDESCSIHRDRPLVCREYLVTTPAVLCNDPSDESIRRITLPGLMSRPLLHVGSYPTANDTKWVPLTLAPQFAADHSEEAPGKTGREMVNETLAKIWG